MEERREGKIRVKKSERRRKKRKERIAGSERRKRRERWMIMENE